MTSKTVSKNGGYSHNNISPGGHIYDRTTGTWVGEGSGTVGGGYTGDGIGRASMVIHDANGPVGIKLAERPAMPEGPGAGMTSNGVQQAGAPSIGAAVTGAGAPGVSAAAHPRPAERGGDVFRLPDLEGFTGKPMPKSKDGTTVTHVRMGVDLFEPNPWFSDGDVWEQRYAEPGEWVGGIATMAADVAYNGIRAFNAGAAWYRTSPFAGVSPAQQQYNAEAVTGFFVGKPMDPIQNGVLVPQEPVNWGY